MVHSFKRKMDTSEPCPKAVTLVNPVYQNCARLQNRQSSFVVVVVVVLTMAYALFSHFFSLSMLKAFITMDVCHLFSNQFLKSKYHLIFWFVSKKLLFS